MPKVKKTVDATGRPGYIYTCMCGRQVSYYWEPSEPAPKKLEVCFDCVNNLNSEVSK
jgi:hypothetical protein